MDLKQRELLVAYRHMQEWVVEVAEQMREEVHRRKQQQEHNSVVQEAEPELGPGQTD